VKSSVKENEDTSKTHTMPRGKVRELGFGTILQDYFQNLGFQITKVVGNAK
jgi:hypothetical protein